MGNNSKFNFSCFILAAFIFFFYSQANSDIGLLLHESIGNPWFMKKKVDTGFLTQGGHAAILVTELCAETPTQIRRCLPGENPGVVISRYDGLSREEYDWLAIPVSWYFDGVESPEERPLFATGKVYEKLAERFYERFLSKRISRKSNEKLPEGRWKDTLAASFRRDIYSFNLKSSKDIQEKILDQMGKSENQSQFDFFLGNCSDFAADFFDKLFENFQRTNLADTGLTSPKGVAQSVARLGRNALTTGYNVKRFSQIPGDFDRSRRNLFPMENAIGNPKYTALLVHYQPILQLGFGIVWGFVFRFDPEKEFRNHFSVDSTVLNYISAQQSALYDQMDADVRAAHARGDSRAHLRELNRRRELLDSIAQVNRSTRQLQDEKFGTNEEWTELQRLTKATRLESGTPQALFGKLEKDGDIQWEGDSLVLNWNSPTGPKRAVIAGEGVGSGDAELVRWIKVSRLVYYADSAKSNRPPIDEVRRELSEVLNSN